MMGALQANAFDPNALGELKRLARDGNSPEAIRAAAKQFEALFLQMVLKAMRDATPANGLLDSDQTRLFQAMQDQQLALSMAQGRGVGLAEVIVRQLGGEGASPVPGAHDESGNPVFDLSTVTRRPAILAARPRTPESDAGEAAALAAGRIASPAQQGAALAAEISTAIGAAKAAGGIPEGARDFVNRVWSHAREASRSTGIPPHFMIAQAALETGWGRAQLRLPDGTPSHNLFNIKAGRNWQGPVVELEVTEYANGRAYTEKARFRAYASYAEAFRDYADLLLKSPRYEAVIGQKDAAGFARSLQQAGFATDPMYADKLTRIIGGSTLRNALAG